MGGRVIKACCALLRVSLLLLIAGCATQEQVGEAVHAINRAFQAEYERILDERGVRVFKVSRGRAFVALHAALSQLGMRVADQDPEAGTLTVTARAPQPLSADEWRRAVEADTPLMHKIVCPIVGDMACQRIKFEPEGLEIVINATVLAVNAGSEVSLTTRMRQVAPPPSGMPRREYPPPSAVRVALDNIWAQFDRELAEQERRGAR